MQRLKGGRHRDVQKMSAEATGDPQGGTNDVALEPAVSAAMSKLPDTGKFFPRFLKAFSSWSLYNTKLSPLPSLSPPWL